MEKNNQFEQAFEELQKMAENIKQPETTLEDAMEFYEKGMNYYKVCSDILENAKQKIEFFEGEV